MTARPGVRRVAVIIAAIVLLTGSARESTVTDRPSTTNTTTSDVATSLPTTTTPQTTATTTTPPTTTTTTTGPSQPIEPVRTGADRLVASNFAAIAGSRVGLISHQNSVVNGQHLADHLAASDQVELVALFGPEHGARGDRDAGEYVEDTTDPATGVPVFSLFGETRQPTASMLEGIDVMLYDLQDVGTRFYTYISTMGLAMQTAAAADIPFIVLDRPNPLGGQVGGGVLDEAATSFVGLYPVPDIYGLTSGELALAIKANGWLPGLESLELSVIEMTGWDGSMLWEDTGLDWTPPSPALTTADAALVYPMTVYLEATSVNYGRGTDRPFTLFGAPWLDAQRVAAELDASSLPGLRFTATTTTPRMLDGMTVEPAFLDVEIPAILIDVVDASAVRPADAGVHLLAHLLTEGSDAGTDVLSRPEWLDQLSGSPRLREALQRGVPIDEILDQRHAEVALLSRELEEHHLYPRAAG